MIRIIFAQTENYNAYLKRMFHNLIKNSKAESRENPHNQLGFEHMTDTGERNWYDNYKEYNRTLGEELRKAHI